MHPPYVGGVGYTYLVTEPVLLPQTPEAAFRCIVGKKDGSDLGDGILFRVEIMTAEGARTLARQVVARHEWIPIEVDLSDYRGKEVRFKLIADVGEQDNSSGDWACWAEMRIESRDPLLVRTIHPGDAPEFQFVPGPYPVKNLRLSDLRSARRAWLHYDGMGLEASDRYPSSAVINGVEIGPLAPAGGSETAGLWAEDVKVPLPKKSISTLSTRNEIRLLNPRRDYFKVRRFWLEVELADGRRVSSLVTATTFTQPPEWPYFEGVGVPFSEDIQAEIWFETIGE